MSWKLSRTVLRGGTNRKVGPLLGKRTGTSKQPYCFEVNDGELFAFAGLWDRWRAPDGVLLETCTIMTTTANHLLEGVHDRMPVILAPDHYDLWLDPRVQIPSALLSLLTPFDAGSMRSYPVSTRVNTVVNDDPECSAAIQLVAETLNLFD